jgi:ribosomal protein S12 methylthiotransferase accessory factor
LPDVRLAALLDRLENNELDEYSDIATLIGIEFDENTIWGQLTVLELKLLIHLDDELEMSNFTHNLRRIFGDTRMDAVLGSIDGSVRFYGLTPTSLKLEGFDRHQRLLDSLKKLHRARGKILDQKLT